MTPINYSFIIPNKNLTDLLRRCLDSIPHREDVQIIVIDDNSDPDKVDFQNYPGLNEPCTEVIFTKENRGAGYARNCGLKVAKGKWLIFLDSDDFLSADVDALLDKHVDDIEDIIYFDIISVFSEDLKPSNLNYSRSAALARYKDCPKSLDLYCRYFYTQPWGKILKKSFIDEFGISFEESKVANDYWFSVVSGFYAKKISYDDAILYIYTERKGSLSNIQVRNEDVAKIRLDVYLHVQTFFDKNNVPFIPFFEFSLGLYRMGNTYRELFSRYITEKEISYIYIIYRYLKGKIFQLISGVKE